VRIVAEAKNIDVPVAGTSHFCGINLFPTVTVDPHPRREILPDHRGKGRGKGAEFMNAQAAAEAEKAGDDVSGSGESESESESSGDEDENANAGKSARPLEEVGGGTSLSDNEDEDFNFASILKDAAAVGARKPAKRARVSK